MSNDALLLGWRKLWNRSLRRFIGRRVRTRVDIEELAQETYLRLLRARDLARRAKSKGVPAESSLQRRVGVAAPPAAAQPVDRVEEDSLAQDCEPVLGVDAAVSHGELERVLADLSPMTRAVVLLRFRDNLQCKDIAREPAE